MSKVQNIIEINVQEPYLSFIRDGVKTVEGRLNKGRFNELQIGDTLVISGIDKKYSVIGKKTYKSFLEMVTNEGFKRVIPDKENEADAAQVYYKFFTAEQEKEFGVVAIEIQDIAI